MGIMGVNTPCGSRVFGGDFMQTLPVKPHVSRGEIITYCEIIGL